MIRVISKDLPPIVDVLVLYLDTPSILIFFLFYEPNLTSIPPEKREMPSFSKHLFCPRVLEEARENRPSIQQVELFDYMSPLEIYLLLFLWLESSELLPVCDVKRVLTWLRQNRTLENK